MQGKVLRLIVCLLGVIEPQDGVIKVFGRDLQKNRSEIMQECNFCSAEYNLPWNLSVYEGLLVFAKMYQVKDSRKRVEEVLVALGMQDLKNVKIRNLSFGQRARASLCKAIINKPRLLLLDEPMSSMDPDVVDKGIKLLLKIQKQTKMSILYTSHNMWEIEQVASRIIFINHGKIMAQGSPLELTRQEVKLEAKEPDLREVFIHLSRRAAQEEGKDESN